MENDSVDIIKESNKRFNTEKRKEKIAGIPEIFADAYNDALDYEDDGNYEQAKSVCEKIFLTDEGSTNESVIILLARLFPKVLMDDIDACNKKYRQHEEEYFKFLDSINMNGIMQEYIVETLASLCGLLDNEWYRPLFAGFVRTIEEKGYLSKEEYADTLNSAYASLESVQYYEDARVGIIMKNVLKSGYERRYILNGMDDEEKKKKTELDINTSLFYLCRYCRDNQDEINYIKDNYPYSYECIERDVNEIKENPETMEEAVINELMQFTSDGLSAGELKKAMIKAYDYVLNSRPGPTVIHSGHIPYQRGSSKIGRNDLCPCGSGRKYKQCCGKNI